VSRYGGMTPEHGDRIARLTEDQRARVLERAAIIQEATGCTWPEADALALVAEGITSPTLPGVTL
jgi:hypothetical protein